MIRKIDAAGLSECASVIRSSFATVALEFGLTPENAPRFTAFAVTPERLKYQYDAGRPMYAYFDGDKMVGFYSLHVQDTECELNNLCVLPGYRHHKIGEELLLHAFETARALGCVRMNIGIVEENRQLRAWYERYGFAHTGTKKFEFFPFTCGYMTIIL